MNCMLCIDLNMITVLNRQQDGLSSRGQLSTSNAELNKYYGCNINNLSQILLNFHGHLSS